MELRILYMSFFATLLFYTPSIAQGDSIFCKSSYKHEIGIGFGKSTTLKPSTHHSNNVYKWYPINYHLMYHYNLTPKIGIGISLDYTRSYFTKEICYEYNEKGRFIGGHLVDKKKYTEWISLSTSFRHYWFNKKHFAMYSRYGLGVTFTEGQERNTSILFNLSPFSIEFGDKRLRFYSELLSIGSYGLINGGLKFSL